MYQEGSGWVMMALNCAIQKDDRLLQSLDIKPGISANVGSLMMSFLDESAKRSKSQKQEQFSEQVVDSSDDLQKTPKQKKQSNQSKQKKSLKEVYADNSLVFLGVFFICAILFVFMVFASKKSIDQTGENDLQTQQNIQPNNLQTNSSPNNDQETNDSKESVTTSVDTNTGVKEQLKVSNSVAKTATAGANKFDSAHLYYRSALGFYELGLLKKAIEEIQAGLLRYPGNKLLLSKLTDWEEHMDILVSQTYRDACKHALYLRNLEALQAFSLVIEMSINQQDIRYKESLRMHKELENSGIGKRVECGA